MHLIMSTRNGITKPAGMVSYGGVSEGVRTLTTLKIMVEAVAIPNISAQFDDMENFMPDDHHVRSENALLTELYK